MLASSPNSNATTAVLSSEPMPSARVGDDSGELIRKLRVKRGLTQETLASKIGISVTSLHKLETGQTRRLRSKTAAGLLAALDATADDLHIETSAPAKRQRLTAEQQRVVDDILSLRSDELETVRQAIQLVAKKRRAK